MSLVRQAALLQPHLATIYLDGLNYAERAKDSRGMRWAASHLLSEDWPIRNHELHLKYRPKSNP